MAPALGATRGPLRHNLSASRTETGGRPQRRWLNGLIVIETALGVVLLVAATLVIGGLDRLARTDPGFDVSQVTTMRVNLPDSRYPYLEQVAFYDRLLPELARLPGVDRRRPGRSAAAQRLALRHQLRAARRRRRRRRQASRAPASRS